MDSIFVEPRKPHFWGQVCDFFSPPDSTGLVEKSVFVTFLTLKDSHFMQKIREK